MSDDRTTNLGSIAAASPYRLQATNDARRLANFLSSVDPIVRARAAEASGRFPGSLPVVEALLRGLQNEEDPKTRRAFIRALGAVITAGDLCLGSPDRSLHEPDLRRQTRAREALTAILQDEQENRDQRGAALEALGSLVGREDLRPFVEFFRRSLSHRDRRSAFRAIGQSGDRAFFSAALAGLDDRDEAAQALAYMAVGRLGIEEAEERLKEAVLHGRENLRDSALQSLAALGSPGACEALTAVIEGPDPLRARRARVLLADLEAVKERPQNDS